MRELGQCVKEKTIVITDRQFSGITRTRRQGACLLVCRPDRIYRGAQLFEREEVRVEIKWS